MSAFALDAADGVIDGKYFGSKIVGGGYPAPKFSTPSYLSSTAPHTTSSYTTTAPSFFPQSNAPYTTSSYLTTPSFPQANSALALDAADGVIDGKYFGSKITTSHDFPKSYLPSTSYLPQTTSSSAFALDAADGVIDGKFFGSNIVGGSSFGTYPGAVTTYSSPPPLALGAPIGFGAPPPMIGGVCEVGGTTITEDIVIGEEVVNVPVRVPVRIRREIQHMIQHAPPLMAPPSIQFVDRYIEGPSQVQEVEKIVRVYVCNGCGKDIEGDHLEMANGRFHRECYVDCAACGRWIQFDAYEAFGQMWHREHFLCQICGKTCADGWVLHNGKQAHQGCIVVKPSVTRTPGMAAKREIKAKTFEEAVRYDEMGGGAPDGKYNGISIVCSDPRWIARCKQRGYDLEATWECSDATVAQRYKSSTGKTVVSTDGIVDGNV